MNDETKLFGGIIIATLVIVVGAVFFLSRPAAPPKPADSRHLIRDDSPKITTDSAKVTMVEFGDYQCPACGAYQPLLTKLFSEFKDSLTFVFREYPLPIHQNAQIAAQAAVAAGMQGKYWEMHDMLYAKQSVWSEEKNAKEIFIGYAKDAGLDVEKFTKDIDSDAVKAVIKQGIDDGNALGINATPTFYLNGQKLENPGSYAELETLVKNALSQKP